MKKISSLLLCAVLMVTLTTNVFAEKSKTKNETLVETDLLLKKVEQYGLRDVNEVPEGIKPIKINSEEELEEIMKQISSGPSVIEVTIEDSFLALEIQEIYTENGTYFVGIASTTTNRTAVGTTTIPGAYIGLTGNLNLYVNYDYYFNTMADAYIYTIRHHYMSLTGFTPALGLGGYSCSAVISSGAISASGIATIDYYLLIQSGFTKVYSKDANLSYKHTVTRGTYDLVAYWLN